jgi:hypothetical protein
MDKTPDVSSKYGAPMGRHTGPNYLSTEAGKIQLQRVRLNNGGYDAGGAYWGHGQALWCAMDQDGNTQYFRAYDRDSAKAKIVADWPDAKFFR